MKKFIALITALSLVSCSFFTVIYAEENLGDNLENTPMLTSEPSNTTPKPLDYSNVLYFEDFDGDTSIDKSTTQKFGNASVTVKSGDSELTTKEESGEYLEIMPSASGGDLTYGLNYGGANSPVGSKYPASEIDKLAKMQVSFDLCPVDIDKLISVSFREKLSTTSVKMKNLMFINTNGTFSFEGTSKKYSYSEGVWVSVDFYFDFAPATPVYSVYIDDEAVFENAQVPTLDKCVEAFIFYIGSLKTGEDYTFYLDNTRIAIPEEFEVVETILSQNGENVNVLDPVKIKFSNKLVGFNESLVTVSANDTLVPAASYTVSESDSEISVAFKDKMEFNTDYTVTVDKSIKDIYGQTLAEDYVLEFKTMTSQIVASAPVFSTNVTTKVVNPSAEPINPVLVVSVKDANGSVTLYKDTKQIEAGILDTIPLTYDISSLQTGQVATAFVVDSFSSLKPLSDVFVQKDGQYSSVGKSSVTANITKAEIDEDIVTVEGQISPAEEQAVIVKVSDETGSTILAIPVKTGEDGKFTCEYSVSNLASGEHSISLTGYYVSASDSKEYIYLSDVEKEKIKGEINDAASADGISTVLAKYKSMMTLDEKYYCDNIYSTLFDQKPFAKYADVITMIKTADALLIQLNAADWSEYSKIFTDNSEILLKNANEEKLKKYKKYSANQKNEINKIIFESSPFVNFSSLRTAFNSASLPSGGGGGGGGNRTPSTPSEVTSAPKVDTYSPTEEIEKDTTGLFLDMTLAKWAEESVKQLYNKKIVSAASNYRPMDNITREEFVKMLVQLAGLSLGEENPAFSDVKGNEWFAPYLGAAQAAGIIKGSDNGSFGIGSFITRQDMVVMAQRTVEAMNKTLKYKNQEVQFVDAEQISDYATDAVSMMQRAGVVNGMGNGSFEPQGLANRAQSAVIICNLINSMK